MRAARPAIHARRAALVLFAMALGRRRAPRPRRGHPAPCLPGEHRRAARLGRPGDLRPVRRREPPDDAQHRPPGDDPHRPHPAPAPGTSPGRWSGPTPPGFERQGASQRLRLGRERSRSTAPASTGRSGATPCSRRCGSPRGRSGLSAPRRAAGLERSPRLGHDRLPGGRRPRARQAASASPVPTSSTRSIPTAAAAGGPARSPGRRSRQDRRSPVRAPAAAP